MDYINVYLTFPTGIVLFGHLQWYYFNTYLLHGAESYLRS